MTTQAWQEDVEHADMKYMTDWGNGKEHKERNMGTDKGDEAKLKVIHRGQGRPKQENDT